MYVHLRVKPLSKPIHFESCFSIKGKLVSSYAGSKPKEVFAVVYTSHKPPKGGGKGASHVESMDPTPSSTIGWFTTGVVTSTKREQCNIIER